jgi:tetratricopeptide (TPR) repeat protein
MNYSHKLTYAFFILFSFTISPVFTQSDALSFDFYSDFEKECFQNFKKTNLIDTIGFFMSLDTKATAKNAFDVKNNLNSFVERINTEGGKKKKNLKKFLDYLFEQVHFTYLKKYEANVPFDKIFKTGTYNCLTATALYALIFERMGIKYQIKEAPTHVYLVADPGNLGVLIETTDPQGGYFLPNEKFKKQFVAELISSKMITEKELASDGFESTFEKYFYENESIDLKQLVALHYNNAGVALSELESNKAAYEQFDKGYFLFPSKRLAFALKGAIFSEITNWKDESYDKIENVRFLLNIVKVDSSEKMQSHLVNDFEKLTERNLIIRDNEKYYNEIYKLFKTTIKDSASRAKIEETYYSVKGRAAYLKGNTEGLNENYKKAFKLNPENIQYSGVIVELFAKNIAGTYLKSNGFSIADSTILVFEKEYPTLIKHPSFMKAKSIQLVYKSVSAFENSKVEDGFRDLKNAEEYIQNNNVENANQLLIDPYVKIVLLFIGEKKYSDAKIWIEKGCEKLKNYPESQTRLKDLGSDIERYHWDLPQIERGKAIKKDLKKSKSN